MKINFWEAGVAVVIKGRKYLVAEETCELLGVKPQTLYAYVSRGVLTSYREGSRRRRLYLEQEVESLRTLAPRPEARPAVALAPAADWIGER